jgi:hypothetical protein
LLGGIFIVISYIVVKEVLSGVTFEQKFKIKGIHALSRERTFQAEGTSKP